MRGIAIWIADQLLTLLEGWLHPEQKARWDDLKKRSADLDAAHAQLNQAEADLQARQVESGQRTAAAQAKIDEDDRVIEAAAEQRKQIADDLANTETDIDSRPDTDRIERPLPGTGNSR